MPLSIYCPSCGAKSEYTINKPRFCHSCAKEFSGGLKNTSTLSPITSSAATHSKLLVTNRSRPPLPDGDEEDDFYDKDRLIEEARQIAASMSAADLGIIVTKPEPRGHKLEDILNPNKQVDAGHRGAVEINLPPE